jgi:hypothetical protein
MQVVNRGLWLAVVGALVLGAVPARTQAPAIDLKVVKYDDLAKEVARHKGKVVVVDAWGIT